MNNKKLLQNLYTLAIYHAKENRMRANDLLRQKDSPQLHWNDKGLADAYEAIVFYLQRPELLEKLDYNKIMKVNNEIPSWLK